MFESRCLFNGSVHEWIPPRAFSPSYVACFRRVDRACDALTPPWHASITNHRRVERGACSRVATTSTRRKVSSRRWKKIHGCGRDGNSFVDHEYASANEEECARLGLWTRLTSDGLDSRIELWGYTRWLMALCGWWIGGQICVCLVRD